MVCSMPFPTNIPYYVKNLFFLPQETAPNYGWAAVDNSKDHHLELSQIHHLKLMKNPEAWCAIILWKTYKVSHLGLWGTHPTPLPEVGWTHFFFLSPTTINQWTTKQKLAHPPFQFMDINYRGPDRSVLDRKYRGNPLWILMLPLCDGCHRNHNPCSSVLSVLQRHLWTILLLFKFSGTLLILYLALSVKINLFFF